MSDLIPLPSFLRDVFESEGLHFGDLLRRAGIAALPFHGERLRLNTKQFFALWSAVEASGLSADFGLRLVTRPTPQQFDVASAAALHSENLGAAIAKLARYKRLTCPEEIKVDLDGEEARVQVVWLGTESAVPALIMDAAFAALHRLAAIGTGRTVTPVRIELTRSHDDEGFLARHFGCELRLQSARDLLVFRRTDFESPFCSHNPDLLDLILPGLEAALKARAGTTTLADHVRAALLRQMRGRRPAIDDVGERALREQPHLATSLGR